MQEYHLHIEISYHKHNRKYRLLVILHIMQAQKLHNPKMDETSGAAQSINISAFFYIFQIPGEKIQESDKRYLSQVSSNESMGQ